MVVLVTGSSRGIGRSIILEYARRGLDVVINYHKNDEAAKKLEKEIKDKYDVRVLTIKCDVSKEDEVEAMFNQIIDEFGKLDILVNNAGVSRDTMFMDIRVKDFKRILDVNLIGAYLCSKYALKEMLNNKKGNIVNISSTNAIDTYYPESACYDASKAGIISLTHNLALEGAPFVRVNAICPGWVNTDMNKNLSIEQIEEEKKNILLNKFGDPKEIAKVVVFVSSSDASYINDSIIRVDGGKYN
ncbi:MAG: SDR family oxidoreductase [Bacilli bacterium]|nr:SDR family oxidoreductase [Bacilli bacterium]